jgi:hypothetical protein
MCDFMIDVKQLLLTLEEDQQNDITYWAIG